jgi:hypothetical protein
MRKGTGVEGLLSAKQATDLAWLLATVSRQSRLGQERRDQAGYWATQIDPGLREDDAQTIAWLLEDVAGSHTVPDHMQQWASAWAATLADLAGGRPAP